MTWENAHDVLEEKRKPQNRTCVWCDGKHCSKKKKGGPICIEKVQEIFLENKQLSNPA